MTAPGTALIRPPGPGLPDPARSQYRAYVSALSTAGWRIQELPPSGDAPQDAFVADDVVIIGTTALCTRPAGEAIEQAVRDLGLAVTRVEAPAVLHGADVVFAPAGPLADESTGGTVYVGRSGRSSDDAACEIAKVAGGPSVRVVPVAVRDLPHLTAAMTVLPGGAPIGLPDHVDTSALPGLQVALEPSGAQILVLGERHLLMAASAPRTAARLRADGYRVDTVDLSEFEAGGGTVARLGVLVEGR